ncbi:hypothetical protein [Flavobacterium glaciei]|uniref:Uncharacterized protein n=1 Tax=Flavobacterium glaciei TaxID=386300 RepID=A0A562PV23_9FLAO|nr:hypothetical protein [Flavobacterium glaciei]RDI55049.1 hypothetical protein DFR66_106158 [Flavobacterium glaciei]TWI47956.1 hypothetical protein IQ02_01544 [Flavobacterium glaciei]
MIKPLFFLFLFFNSFQSYSQKLVYKSNGTITDIENNKIAPNQVRELLKDNEQLITEYNDGRSKKTLGNILLYSGIGFLTADLVQGVTASGISATPIGGGQYALQDEKNNYPSLMTYIGIAAIIIAIPVKIGFSKKIKNVVTDYNNQKASAYTQFNEPSLDLITNSNGIGLRMTLN